MPPPHGLSRGKTFLSSSTVETPIVASVRPAIEPAGPPPTTRTSASYAVICEVTPETYRLEASKGQEALKGSVRRAPLLPRRRLSSETLKTALTAIDGSSV